MIKPKSIGWKKSDDSPQTDVTSSVRGKSISSPIPFPDNDEFPFSSHGSTTSISHEPQDVEKQLQLETLSPMELCSVANEDEEYFTDSDNIESFDSRRLRLRYSPPPLRTQLIRARASTTSAALSKAAVDKSKGKKSSLRAAFGKLFGKKQKESHPPRPRRDSVVRDELRRSEVIPKNIRKSDNPAQQRSVSLPINEIARPGRLHSTPVEDFRFPLTPNLNRGFITPVGGRINEEQERPRRATLSGLWSPGRIPGYADWTGLSPRPASTHAKDGKLDTDDAAEGGVGIALTSESYHNRKSRSAGELRNIVTGFDTRDGGNKRWKEGNRLASPLTPANIKADLPNRLPQTPFIFQVRGPIDHPLSPSIKDEAVEQDLPRGEDTSHDEGTESQPFNFESGVKVPDRAIAQSAILDERIHKLEDRMCEIEKFVLRTSSHTLENQPVGEEKSRKSAWSEDDLASTRPETGNLEISMPEQHQFRERLEPRVSEGLTSQASAEHSSYNSRRPSISTNTSYQPSLDAEPLPELLTSTNHKNGARPLSNTDTIRGPPATFATFLDDSKPTEEGYASLLNMITAEREARRELEALVLKLQQRLHTLAWTSGPGSKPPGGRVRVAGQFLDLEQDDSSIDDAQYTDEEFRPDEETGLFGDEIFGDTAHVKKRGRTAPRVMSLSQMTLGRNVQPDLEF